MSSSSASENVKDYTGGCHCKRFRYKFSAAAFDDGQCDVYTCNCSMCTMNGCLVNAGVPRTGIEFTSGSLDELTTYKFNTKVFVHHFCPTCGIELMCSNTGADTMGVNVRSVDGIELEKLKLHWFDGKNAL